MPRIIHLITGLVVGGAERALYNLLHGGMAGQFDCRVISLSDVGTLGPQIKSLGIPVDALDMPAGRASIAGLAKLRRIVRDSRPDLIQGWMYHGNLAATLARSLAPGRPVLAWNIRHSLYGLEFEKPMSRQVIRINRLLSSTPDALLYNSSLSRKQHEDFGFAPRNGHLIPNGIDVDRFCFSDDARERTRSELGIPTDAQVVGHIARLHPMKDHALFLQVAVDLASSFPETHFLLCGRNVSLQEPALGPLVPDPLRDRFHLLDERDDIFNLMSAMDIFCLSSAWGEGFPNVIGEAMATGLPCVATDVGDSAVIIGNTGVVVPPRDANALTEGIASLLTMSREKRRNLNASTTARINAKYTLAEIVNQYAALYRQLIAAAR